MLNKPDFIDEEQIFADIEKHKNPDKQQVRVFQAELNQVEFELELSEHIDITTGKGDIYITLEKQSPDSYDKIDTGLSFETEYEDCPAEQIQSQFGNHVAAQQHYNRMQHPPHCNGQFLMLKVIRR